MTTARGIACLTCLALACAVGCRREVEIEQTVADEWQSRYQAKPLFTYMVDNAILSDMSVADIHFIPHHAELGSTGMHRLDRMAPMLNTYGGTIRYQTYHEDQQFVQARMASIRDYLAVVGCDLSDVTLESGLPGGRGIPASEVTTMPPGLVPTSAPASADAGGGELLELGM